MWKHSVRLETRRCKGCTNCIKRCPTEALRVQNGKVKIIDERCVDCGECVDACPYKALTISTDCLKALERFKFNIAVPSPALYAQFKGLFDPADIMGALVQLGFDYVYEEAKAAEIVSEATRKLIRSGNAPKPLISTNCPAITRLIQVQFQGLIDNLLPFETPAEIGARIARKEFCEATGVDPAEVGVFSISPCAARLTKETCKDRTSTVDGVIPVSEVYPMISKIFKEKHTSPDVPRAGAFGVGWAMTGGESTALGINSYLAVDGIQSVINCLEELENTSFNDLHFLECSACVCGCAGGPLCAENSFVAKNRVRRIANSLPRIEFGSDAHVQKYINSDLMMLNEEILPQPVLQLDDDVVKAAQKMEQMRRILRELPGLDCGSCGSPSCATLAEDIVRGNAVELDCIFKMRDRVRLLAQEMVELADAHKRG